MKWLVFVVLILIGFYLMFWSFQSAWISATPVANPAHYKKEAVVLFWLSIAVIAIACGMAYLFRKRG